MIRSYLQNKTKLYIVYKKQSWNIKTQIGLKVKDGKRYALLMLIKRNLEELTNIRQSRFQRKEYHKGEEKCHFMMIRQVHQ